jgi:hypothetical protein
MKRTIIFIAILQLFAFTSMAQSGPFVSNAKVILTVNPRIPVKGTDFAVQVYIDTDGVVNTSSVPAVLGAFIMPISFDNNMVTLKSVSNGKNPIFASSGLAATEISLANTCGYVTIVGAQLESNTLVGRIHVATLVFSADQAGRVVFANNSDRGPVAGSLSSIYDSNTGEGPAQIFYDNRVVSFFVDDRHRAIRPKRARR